MNELKIVVEAIDNKMGKHIEAIDVSKLFPFADYFVICEANNEKQLQAIVSELKDQVERAGMTIKKIEGVPESGWILVEVDDVIIHIFSREQREHYGIERLWGDAEKVDVSEFLV
ncbi:ribosome silencing factor [Culicoidibacter larvae]|uniref:Ribosomal silencing factor RsfS n=1 Tax=Culicoidibacter larvae TaxID=2579976 RepID=A0A5R8QCM8_9FIRM|nr:ribosome silencing factor [Culicoidibacter larvae]TLG74285.1 ribosome silencing factor [Culicoidibacter larvae]